MNWGEAKIIIGAQMPNSNSVLWLEDLIAGDIESKRLAICLAIEIKSSLLNKDHLDKIFSDCDYDRSLDPRSWFAKKLDEVKDFIKKKNGCVIESNELSRPVRLATFLNFYRLWSYYLKPLHIFSDIDLITEEDIITFIQTNPYILNQVPYFGDYNRNVVWVTPIDEVKRIESITKYRIPTCYLNDLGLSQDDEGIKMLQDRAKMYFMVEYPDTFSETVYHPTSLNKNWKNVSKDLYLSFPKLDKCGRTYATDGFQNAAKEQIHEPAVCKDLNFKIIYIGKHDDLPMNRNNMIPEGFKRLAI